METRTYECVLVLDPGLNAERITEQLERFQELILQNRGLIRKWDRWGKKRLAYEIQRKQYGYFAVVVFDSETTTGRILDRYLRLNQYVLRHLIVLLEPSQIPPIEPNAEISAESEMAESEAPKPKASEATAAADSKEESNESEMKSDEQTKAPSVNEEENAGESAAEDTAEEVV